LKSAGIVGAGIVGRVLALHLLRKGWQVTLFDHDILEGKGSCSYAAAGMLSPLAELETAETVIFDLGIRSMTLWSNILPTLNQPVYFQREGSLLLAHRQDIKELERIKNYIEAKLLDLSMIQILTPSEILELEPALAHWPSQGLYLSLDGQIDNRMLLAALRSTLIENGVIWKYEVCVQRIEPGKVICSLEEYNFDVSCDCRGLGAKDGYHDLRGVRGELIHLHAPEVNIFRPIRLLHPRYRLYIVPRPNNIYIIGASEIESEEFSSLSVRTTLELLSAAYSLHPGFAEARVIDTSVNCRPAFPDNLPRIFYTEGLLSINGLYRHGYLLAPALIEEAISMLENKTHAFSYP